MLKTVLIIIAVIVLGIALLKKVYTEVVDQKEMLDIIVDIIKQMLGGGSDG